MTTMRPSGHGMTLRVTTVTVILCYFARTVVARSCRQLDACRCQFDDDKSIVNLWPLGHLDGNPLFLDHSSPDGFRYSYNPCYPFSEGQCQNSTICKTNTTNEVIARVTTEKDSSFFSFDGTHVILGYVYPRQGGGKIMSQVTLACDPSQTLPLLTNVKHVSGIIQHYVYRFIATAALAPSTHSTQGSYYVFKYMKGSSPEYLSHLLIDRYDPQRSLRSTNILQLKTPRYRVQTAFEDIFV